MSAALAMAAAAVFAIYVAGAPNQTLDDTLSGDIPTTTYVQPVNLFGPEVSAQDTGIQDPLLQESPASLQNELAG